VEAQIHQSVTIQVEGVGGNEASTWGPEEIDDQQIDKGNHYQVLKLGDEYQPRAAEGQGGKLVQVGIDASTDSPHSGLRTEGARDGRHLGQNVGVLEQICDAVAVEL